MLSESQQTPTGRLSGASRNSHGIFRMKTKTETDGKLVILEKVLETVYWAALLGCFIFIGMKEPAIGVGCLFLVLLFHSLSEDHDIDP